MVAYRLVAGLLIGAVSDGYPTGARIAMAMILAVGLLLLVRSLRRRKMVVSVDRIVFVTSFTQRGFDWSELAGITTEWVASAYGSGRSLRLIMAPGAGPNREAMVLLPEGTQLRIREFLERHHIPVPVDPRPPWPDRFGRWNGPMFDFNPAESIRSIRRAWVGPWQVSVTPSPGEGFRASVDDIVADNLAHQAPMRHTLAAAISDGERFVRAAQRELTGRTRPDVEESRSAPDVPGDAPELPIGLGPPGGLDDRTTSCDNR